MKLRDLIECLDDDCHVKVVNYNNARLIEHGRFAGDVIPSEDGDDNTTLLYATVRILKTYPEFYTQFLELEVTNLSSDDSMGKCAFHNDCLEIDLSDSAVFEERVRLTTEKARMKDDK